MKNLILVILIFININIFAQSNNTTSYVTNSNTEKLIDKYAERVENAITTLANKLEQPAEHVYDVLTTYYYTLGLTHLIPIILLFIFGTLSIIFHKFGKWDDIDAKNIPAVLTYLCLVITVGSLITTFICIQDAILYISSPEYYVLKNIMELIR